MTTPTEQLVTSILAGYAGPYYVAGTSLQQARVVREAAKAIEPQLAELAAAQPSFVIPGVLIRAGTFPVRDEEITGLVISCSRETLAALARLPMYQPVIVSQSQQAAARELAANPS